MMHCIRVGDGHSICKQRCSDVDRLVNAVGTTNRWRDISRPNRDYSNSNKTDYAFGSHEVVNFIELPEEWINARVAGIGCLTDCVPGVLVVWGVEVLLRYCMQYGGIIFDMR